MAKDKKVDETPVEEAAPQTDVVEEAAPETDEVVGANGEKVEKSGSGSGAKGFYVYECSAGDFVSRESAEAVEKHIGEEHAKS